MPRVKRGTRRRRWPSTSATPTAPTHSRASARPGAFTCVSGRGGAMGSGASPSTFCSRNNGSWFAGSRVRGFETAPAHQRTREPANRYNQRFELARISGQTHEVRPQGESTEHQAPGTQPADALEAPERAQGDPRLARREGPLRREGGYESDRVDRGQDGHQGHHPPQHRGTVQVASRVADVQGRDAQNQRVVAGLLQRVSTRSRILPVLRRQWRDDQAATLDKLETRFDKRLTSLKEQVDRVAALAETLQGLEALAGSVDRITNVDREVRMLRATLALDIEDRHRVPHGPAVFDADRVGAHVARAIAAAPVQTDPSVHIVINQLTPADTYDAVLDGIPPRIFFSQRDNAKQNLRLAQMDVAPERTLHTLAFIENVLIPKLMVPALLRKFEPYFREFYVREYGPERGPALAAVPHEATSGRLMLQRS